MKKIFFILIPVYLIFTSFVLPRVNTKIPNRLSDSIKVKPLVSDSKLSSSEQIYTSLDFTGGEILNQNIFEKAFIGFEKLKVAGELPQNAKYLSVADFGKSSNTKRLWVIDMEAKTIVFNTLVAHGMGTGEEFAEKFSNTESSHQSSLGFYVTDATYNGGNGYSLKLLGMDKGYNDAAFQRAIVMHGADYVSDDFAKAHKRIGRSWGCPAVSRDLAEPIINTIKGKNLLFIYYPDENYLNSSEWLKA